MAKETVSTRALLTCGVVAGPLYVAVTMIQVLTRAGFDMRHHRFNVLTAGDLGWIHQLNMLMVGVLSALLALGVSRVMRGWGAMWAPRLLALFGLAYVVGGLFPADPMLGFPAGTTAEMVQHTWHGIIQNGSRGVSSLLLLATSLVIARSLAAEGRRGAAWFFATALFAVFAVLAVFGRAIGVNPVAPAFLATPWVWVTALAVYMIRRESERRTDVAGVTNGLPSYRTT